MNQLIFSLNDKFASYLNQENSSIGLADGKMGGCIYFYHLSSISKDRNHKKIADNLLDNVFNNIDRTKSIDIKKGLAGIGVGINYLIKCKYVEGDINIVLNDVDNLIFQDLSYTINFKENDSFTIIQVLYYLCIRFKQQKHGSENEYLYKELIIKLINDIYRYLPENFYDEPLTYTVDYILPQFLFIINEVYKLGFYNYRLIRITEELSYKIMSIYPILHSNRLFLLWGMNLLNKKIDNKQWNRHLILLREHINIETIISYEMRNKNIFFNNGLSSIYFFINNLPYHFNIEERNKIIEKINRSEIWNFLNDNPSYFKRHCGLYSGFAGVFLLLNKYQYSKR